MDSGTDVPSSGREITSVPGDLPLDLAKYQDDMAELDIPEDQARQLFETMWSIVQTLVELGYNYDVAGRTMADIFNHIARNTSEDEA
jgi:hypothetical protein